MKISPEVSKAVGWDFRVVPWPTTGEVINAITTGNRTQLLKWWRFLSSPDNVNGEQEYRRQIDALQMIQDYFKDTSNGS